MIDKEPRNTTRTNFNGDFDGDEQPRKHPVPPRVEQDDDDEESDSYVNPFFKSVKSNADLYDSDCSLLLLLYASHPYLVEIKHRMRIIIMIHGSY